MNLDSHHYQHWLRKGSAGSFKRHRNRQDTADDPFTFAMDLHLHVIARSVTSRYLRSILDDNVCDVQDNFTATIDRVRNNVQSPGCTFYRVIDSNCGVDGLYHTMCLRVQKLERISWTRLRLRVQLLTVEEGRWNRRGSCRLPIKERLCICGSLQTEHHVVDSCPATEHIRQHYGFGMMDSLLVHSVDHAQVCHKPTLPVKGVQVETVS